jgi:hypothetical protein
LCITQIALVTEIGGTLEKDSVVDAMFLSVWLEGTLFQSTSVVVSTICISITKRTIGGTAISNSRGTGLGEGLIGGVGTRSSSISRLTKDIIRTVLVIIQTITSSPRSPHLVAVNRASIELALRTRDGPGGTIRKLTLSTIARLLLVDMESNGGHIG